MMYSAYKLNKQGDNIQPWRSPFLIWNQSVVPCPVLTVASSLAYRFLRRQVRWSGIPISSTMFQFCCDPHSQSLWHKQWSRSRCFSGIPFFLHDPTFVSNLISGSSAFSKPSLYIWKFSVYILLNPNLKDFEHDLTSMWKEHNCTVVWRFFGIVFPWDWTFSSAMSTENGGKYWIVVKMVGRFIILTWNNIWNTLNFKFQKSS